MAKPLLSLEKEAWLREPHLQQVLAVIAKVGGEARVAGGAVRNAVMGEAVTEVDLATSLQPLDVTRVCKAAGFGVHPTGIAHGTVTVVVHGIPFEITTLRRDVVTDGRRATVAFTDDWQVDALRRDFTINAMFADADGKIYDFTGGYTDATRRIVRFVGSPNKRITEDYLRILRFFRFHARYGKSRPDSKGLAACVRHRKGLAKLSIERIRQELLKLLVANRAVPTLKIMSANKILQEILPHTTNWRTLARLPADAVLRLTALATDPTALKSTLKLSNADAKRIEQLIDAPDLSPKLRVEEQRRILYAIGPATWRDAATLGWAKSSKQLTDPGWSALRDLPLHWTVPVFPLQGKDLLASGYAHGPAIGNALRQLEDIWIASDFKPTRDELLQKVPS
jgi:poly(A) polymerase